VGWSFLGWVLVAIRVVDGDGGVDISLMHRVRDVATEAMTGIDRKQRLTDKAQQGSTISFWFLP
jgi:hypothetical protein